jgi:hypothetical protein
MIHESQKLKEKRKKKERKRVRWERIRQKVPQPNNEDC